MIRAPLTTAAQGAVALLGAGAAQIQSIADCHGYTPM